MANSLYIWYMTYFAESKEIYDFELSIIESDTGSQINANRLNQMVSNYNNQQPAPLARPQPPGQVLERNPNRFSLPRIDDMGRNNQEGNDGQSSQNREEAKEDSREIRRREHPIEDEVVVYRTIKPFEKRRDFWDFIKMFFQQDAFEDFIGSNILLYFLESRKDEKLFPKIFSLWTWIAFYAVLCVLVAFSDNLGKIKL